MVFIDNNWGISMKIDGLFVSVVLMASFVEIGAL